MQKLKKTLVMAVFLAAAFLLPGIAIAQGNLLITPRRVVFEGAKRSIDINLANTGQDTAVYAISLIEERMREDGTFETITEPDSGQMFAARFIRFFPRSVKLGPNEAQTIKVQLIRTNELAPGEYRSHFYFRSVPDIKPLGDEKTARDSSTISVNLVPIFGITIPAIIRIGESTAKVTLSGLSLKFMEDTIPHLTMVFKRTGNMSVYGDLAVDYISPQGKTIRVGIANGIAIYTPNTKRIFQLNLNKVPGIDFRTGNLKVTFSAPSDVKPAKYAEAELALH